MSLASPFRSTNDRVHDEKLNYSTVSVLTVVVCCSFTLKMGFALPMSPIYAESHLQDTKKVIKVSAQWFWLIIQ